MEASGRSGKMGPDFEGPFKYKSDEGRKEGRKGGREGGREGGRKGGRKEKVCISKLREKIGAG